MPASSDIIWEDSSIGEPCMSFFSTDESEPRALPQNSRTPSSYASLAQLPANYFEKYRDFIRRNRIILRLVEDSLSRLVLYAPSRFVSHLEEDSRDGHGHRKILPETLYAIIHLWSLSNDVLYHGFGESNGFTVGSLTEGLERNEGSRIDVRAQTILLLRSILSITECLAPSLEVSAYSRPRRNRNRSSQSTSTSEAHACHLNALSMSAKIEKIKFACRMGLLALNYSKHIKSLKTDNSTDILSKIGILCEGGLLEPDEEVISSAQENERVKKLLYVGKRTGRRMGLNSTQYARDTRRGNTTCTIQQAEEVSKSKIGLLVLGEFLHVYRPLYYLQSSLRHEIVGGDNLHKKMKSWIIALAMDVLSHKLITISKQIRGKSQNRTNISSQSTVEELYSRKMRWMLYLLRAPVWDRATFPIAAAVSGVVRHVPLVGKPVVQYVMDLLMYWQRWHFMLEG